MRGPVHGIGLKLQEEERGRRIQYVPEKSEVDTNHITVDSDTRSMLKELGMNWLPNITTHSAQTRYAAGGPKIIECRSAQRVPDRDEEKQKFQDQMTQRGAPTKLSHNVFFLNVCSPVRCSTTQ